MTVDGPLLSPPPALTRGTARQTRAAASESLLPRDNKRGEEEEMVRPCLSPSFSSAGMALIPPLLVVLVEEAVTYAPPPLVEARSLLSGLRSCRYTVRFSKIKASCVLL